MTYHRQRTSQWTVSESGSCQWTLTSAVESEDRVMLYCAVLCYAVLCCVALCYFCGVVWCSVVVVWCGVVWCGVVTLLLYGVVWWCCVVVVWCGIAYVYYM